MRYSITFMLILALCVSCRMQTDSLETKSDIAFSDTIDILFDTNFLAKEYNTIYCHAEINETLLETVFVDNGYDFSAISPDIASLFASSYTIIESPQKFDPQHWCKHKCKADSLCVRIGRTSFQLDTFDITEYAQIVKQNKSIKAVIGRDFFEKNLVEIDFQNGRMILSKHLPEKTNQFIAIPMYYCSHYNYAPRYRYIKVDGFKWRNGRPAQARAFLDLGWAIPNIGFERAFLKNIDLNFSQMDSTSLAWLVLNEIGLAVDSTDFPIEHMDDNHNVVERIPGSIVEFEEEPFADIILGTDFFRHFDVIFDYKNNMLYLKHNEQ